MIYIKLDESMNLVMTVNEPIYRGDNLNQKIVYLIPLQVGEVDMLAATPYLTVWLTLFAWNEQGKSIKRPITSMSFLYLVG